MGYYPYKRSKLEHLKKYPQKIYRKVIPHVPQDERRSTVNICLSNYP